jgi:hypothetical protein
MSEKIKNYYVYAYIDPRNFEEFYYGKGKGSRKDAHLFDTSDSEKVRRITAIKKEGLFPIIRVLARNLSESEAFLVEKTLLWKLGKLTTNIATGNYSENFRPQNSMHKEISGFDYQSGIYYYNIGEGETRNWDDYVKYGFISAGQAPRYRDAMLGFNLGDIFAAYLKGKGFVGIGRVTEVAKMVNKVVINGRPLLLQDLQAPGLGLNNEFEDTSEYACCVEWLKTVPRDQAKFCKSPKLFTTTHVRASLDSQAETIKFLEEQFQIEIRKIAE